MKLSMAPVGSASAKMPTPPRMTVARRPANGDHAKPIFGCATTAVTEGKAVCCPVTIALFTGTFTSIVPSGPARCWKQLVWQTGLDRCSRRTLSVSFRLLLTRMSSDAYAPNWYSAIGCSSFCGKFCTIRLPGPPAPPVANASRDRGRTSGVTELAGRTVAVLPTSFHCVPFDITN